MLFAEIVTRGTFPLWLAILLIPVAIAISVLVYRTESMKISRNRRILLGALRAFTLILLLLLLLKPVWVGNITIKKTRPVAVLLDNSQSMSQIDPLRTTEDRVRVAIAAGKLKPDHGLELAPGELLSSSSLPRIELLKSALANEQLKLLESIRAKAPLQPYLFGSRLRGLPDDAKIAWLSSLDAKDPNTSMLDTARQLLDRDSMELPSAIVIATDGRDNFSKTQWEELAREAARLQVPLHIYGVGGAGTGYLELKDAPVNDTLFFDDTITVPFRYRAKGIQAGELELTVQLGDKVVATKRVPVKDGDDISETLSFILSKEQHTLGKQQYTASIKLVQGDEVYTDQVSKPVKVIDQKVRVLVIESEPRWEFKFLMQSFLRDRRIEPTFIITSGDRRALEAGAPFRPNFPDERKDLFSYHMLVIGDVDANYFTSDQRTWIRDFVSEGRGLVAIAGLNAAPATWVNTTLAELLPVEVESEQFSLVDKRPIEYQPQLTEIGKRASMMMLDDDRKISENTWNELPGWYWYYPVKKLRAAAIDLVVHPKDQLEDKSPMPLMATQYYGKGLVLYIGTDEIWRWRYNEGEKYLERFWGQVAYSIGLPAAVGASSAQLSVAGGEAIFGKPGAIYARLFTPEFRPLPDERVVGKLEKLDGQGLRNQSLVLNAVPNQPGDYIANLPNDQQGRYRLTVRSGGEDAVLEYRVTLPPDHEMAPGPMNYRELSALAEKSAGRFYREESLHEMAGAIQIQTVPQSRRQEILLWSNWLVWGIIVGLFTMEWIIRKFSNMS